MSAQHSHSINHMLALWVLKKHKLDKADGHAQKQTSTLKMRNHTDLLYAFKSKQLWWWMSMQYKVTKSSKHL